MLDKIIRSPINPVFKNAVLDKFVRQEIKTVYVSKLSDIPVNSRTEHCAIVQMSVKSGDVDLSCDIIGEEQEGETSYTIRRLEGQYLTLSGAARTYEEIPFRKNQIRVMAKDACEKMLINAVFPT